MASDAVLDEENAHLELARRCLTEMLASAETIADTASDELTSFALGRLRAERLAALTADPDAPPFFGRIDRADGAEGSEGSEGVDEVFHIGRRHLRDPAGDPVVLDWRAPLSEAFYRAAPHDPMGLRLRRRFGFHDGQLSSYEDEHLDRGEYLGLASDLLRAEIERPRLGPMRDIVATIQPDQDELVRAPLDTSLCVQGAPGTGKTAVGLHRAAFLLYTYPQRLRRTGVLVIGPNQAFLHYIGQVLPSLGEAGIEQTTVAALLGQPAEPAEETPALATLKGDLRLAEVLRRAVLSHVGKPAEDVVALVGTKRYRISAHDLRRVVDDTRRSLTDGLHWRTGRERIRVQVAEYVRRRREDAGGAPTDAETMRVARSQPVREFVDRVWPDLTAENLLARLWDEPEFLARCARGSLSDDERAALHRPRGRGRVRWSAADAALLDELRAMIQGGDSYVHVVLDEAQDLSPMQLRAVGRRCELGSITLLGDLAQATTPWGSRDWATALDALGRPARVWSLTAGYRVPGTVLALANRLLPHIAIGVEPATSVRPGRDAVDQVPDADLEASVRAGLDKPGSIGVIAPDKRTEEIGARLAAAGIDAAGPADDTDLRVTVVPTSQGQGARVRHRRAGRPGRDGRGRAGPARRSASALRRAHPGRLAPGAGHRRRTAGRTGAPVDALTGAPVRL